MFTLTVYLVQHSLVGEIVQSAPPDAPNVFLIGITPEQVGPLKALIAKQKGVVAQPEFAPSVAVRIESVNGVPLEELRADWLVAALPRQPLRDVGRGEAEFSHRNARQMVDAGRDAAGGLDRSGSRADAGCEIGRHPRTLGSRTKASPRASSRCIAWSRCGSAAANEFVFNPPALTGLPATFYGGVRMQPADVGALERAAYQAFPTVTVINVAEALAIVQQVVDQVALVIRFLSGVRDSRRSDHPRRQRSRHALPPRARSGDLENSRRHAPQRRPDFLRGVPDSRRSRRTYGRTPRERLFEILAQSPAGRQVCLRLERHAGRSCADRLVGASLRLARQLPHPAPEAPRSAARRVGLKNRSPSISHSASYQTPSRSRASFRCSADWSRARWR